MKTTFEIIRATASDNQPWPSGKPGRGKRIIQRATEGSIIDFQVRPKKDDMGRPHAEIVSHVAFEPSGIQPWATGRHHEVVARLYPPFGKEAFTWITCTCEWNLFVDEVALTIKGSSAIIHSNAKAPKTTNPAKVPAACKHVYKVLKRAIKDRKTQKVIFQLPTDKSMAGEKAYLAARDSVIKTIDSYFATHDIVSLRVVKAQANKVANQSIRGKPDQVANKKSILGYIDRYLKKKARRHRGTVKESIVVYRGNIDKLVEDLCLFF